MLSALELARQIETGERTPADVLELCAQAIDMHEAEVGAFAYLDLANARERAHAGGKTLAALPLRGLPVGFKDIFDTADMPTGYGTDIYKGYRPHADAALVSMARRAGGNIIGKTVSTPFAFLAPAHTRNPRKLAHTPGGSSSGSAAAVAAGMLPVAVGTQTGGSVIRPAAYCGIAGYKASFQLLPTVGIKCFSWSLDTPGLFAAGVADVAFAAEAITGRDLRIDLEEIPPPRVALVRTHVWPEASPAMQAAIEQAVQAIAHAGGRVNELTLPAILEDAYNAHSAIQNYEVWRALAYEYDHHRDELPDVLRGLLDDAAHLTAREYDEARRITNRARRAFAEFMTVSDVLLTPSAPGAAPFSLESTGVATFNRLWTLLGVPCVNVPGCEDSNGLPLGLQIIGSFGRDHQALQAARFLEMAIAGTVVGAR